MLTHLLRLLVENLWSCYRLFLPLWIPRVLEDHAVVVHYEIVTLYCALGHSGAFPCYDQPGIFQHILRMHLAGYFLAARRGKTRSAEASAFGTYNERAGVDL